MGEQIDWYQAFAEKRRSVPEGWRWFKLDTLNYRAPRDQQTIVVSGGVAKNKTKGKFAGQLDWKARDKSLDRTVAFTFAEIDEFCREWEAETGKCSSCSGTGQTMLSWGASEGIKYEPCRKCSGTGASHV